MLLTMSDAGRYRPPRFHASPAEWNHAAQRVLLDVLDTQYAVTKRELEARASDRTWDPTVWPRPIDPGYFTHAMTDLHRQGLIMPTHEPTRGGAAITTWSRVPVRGLKGRIEDAAARKRLLAARHNGWSQRGGNGLGLIGRAGENALHTALADPECPLQPLGPTRTVLEVELLGEIDNHGLFADHKTDPSDPVVITALFEVKNRRQHYYSQDAAVRRFLAKAAHYQRERPNQLVLPVFVCRRYNITLWREGETNGFLPVTVNNQLVLPDHELDQNSLEEVRIELGYEDLVLGDTPTNRHLGMAKTSLYKYGRPYAQRWRTTHTQFLAEDLDDLPEEDELADD